MGGGFIFKWRVSALGGIGSGVAVGVSKKIVGRGGHPMPHQPSMDLDYKTICKIKMREMKIKYCFGDFNCTMDKIERDGEN